MIVGKGSRALAMVTEGDVWTRGQNLVADKDTVVISGRIEVKLSISSDCPSSNLCKHRVCKPSTVRRGRSDVETRG